MALGLSTTLRNSRLSQIAAAVDGGAGAGVLRIYNGVRPSTGGTATTLLSEHTMSDPAFGAAAGGVLTANSIADDTSANATATATWCRIVDSNGTFIIDGSVGLVGSGADLEMNSVNIGIGQTVSINSLVITEGNA